MRSTPSCPPSLHGPDVAPACTGTIPVPEARRASGAGHADEAAHRYRQALAALLAWRSGVEAHLSDALEASPGFVMARIARAWLRLGHRDPHVVRSAAPELAVAASLPMRENERRHWSAADAVLHDDHEGAKARLGELLARDPHDRLALHMAHLLDHVTGDTAALHDRVAAVLSQASPRSAGYHALLSMHGFGLVERGEPAAARRAAEAALAHEPFDARAHHVMAHVFEMSDRPDEGVRWLERHEPTWGRGTVVATHAWWHAALFHVAQGRHAQALEVYDRQLACHDPARLSDLIDATALLWRLALAGHDLGPRWAGLAYAWAPHLDDAYCSFTDVHAMLAFVGAGDAERAARLEANLLRARSAPSRYGATTRQLGLAACQAIHAFGQGRFALAASLLSSLPPERTRQLGGSVAQRDLLQQTRQAALRRLGRTAHPARPAARALAAAALE